MMIFAAIAPRHALLASASALAPSPPSQFAMHLQGRRIRLLLTPWLFLIGTALIGSTAAADEIQFGKDVRPILARHCFRCHSAAEQEAGLRLDNSPSIAQGGASGAAIVPGKSGESLLIARVSAANPA